ncbi:MAG TPA: hypothetical protein VL992_08410, partial [Tepidisphaeraceae bacterium]|nr:hypothetical protein [Tepidisphaeraceae bacterium]
DGIVTGLNSGQIEIKPTLVGDASLDGSVTFGDFQVLAEYFGQAGGWDEGNFRYMGAVDFGDYQDLAQNFGKTAALAAGQEQNAVVASSPFATASTSAAAAAPPDDADDADDEILTGSVSLI